MDRVGIVGYAQVGPDADLQMGRYESIFKAVRGALDAAGLKKKDITSVVSATNDYYDGRTISNCFTVEAGGAYMADETKVEMDGAYAMLYGVMRVLSGNHKLVVVWGGSMPSTFPYDSTRLLETDPTLERSAELLNHYVAAGFSMRAYMEKFGVSAGEVAEVAAKNHRNAAKNSAALPEAKIPDCTPEQVLASDPLSTPVTELMYARPCDGAACVLLAPEKQALKITDDPVWITSVGYSQETYYLGERDLGRSLSMERAAKTALGAAGVKDPVGEVDVAELFEHFAHEELVLAEAIGFAEPGKGASISPDDVAVNPSGGAIGGNVPCATGLVRVIEACKQLRGEADNQVKGASRAVASGQVGFNAQSNILWVLEGGGA
ncbi:MAG: thiolase family protein [Promethearchaeota archaeon]